MTDQPKPCEMPEDIHQEDDLYKFTNGYFVRQPRTPSPSDSLAQPSLLKNVPTRSSTTAAELSPCEEDVREALEAIHTIELPAGRYLINGKETDVEHRFIVSTAATEKPSEEQRKALEDAVECARNVIDCKTRTPYTQEQFFSAVGTIIRAALGEKK